MQAETELAPQPEFERQITPSETFEKQIVFDLPVDVQNPRLDMREGYGVDHWIEAVLINDEDSIFHKRNYFALRNADALVRMSAKHETFLRRNETLRTRVSAFRLLPSEQLHQFCQRVEVLVNDTLL